MKTFLVDAFTGHKFEGNRAGVIVGAEKLTSKEKQQIASEIYASESAFISRSDVADFKVEFFTPTREIDFCGHNTIAAFYLLAALGKVKPNETGSNFTEATKAGIIPVKVSGEKGHFLVTMTQNTPKFQSVKVGRDVIARALGIKSADLDERFEVKFSNTGNWHLMVGVNSEECLHQISYDTNELSAILEQIGAVTAHVFYMTNTKLFHARNFGPTYGIPEDPATGAAAGAFGAYLVDQGILKEKFNQFEILQGEAMGRPSNISVNIRQNNRQVEKVEVSGTAAISFELLEPSLTTS